MEGLRLFEEVQRSYYGLDRIVNAAASIWQFQQAQLSITCLPVFCQSLLPAVCKSFIERYPEVSFSIIPQESPLVEKWLSAQRYDLGLTENRLTPEGTERMTLITLNEVCVLHAEYPLLARDMLTPQDFADQNYISLSSADSYSQLHYTLFNKQGVDRRLIMETHNAASVCAMVRAGVGLSIINPLTALDHASSGVHMRPFSIDVSFTVSLIRPRHRSSSTLVTMFIEQLHQQAEKLPARLTALISR